MRLLFLMLLAPGLACGQTAPRGIVRDANGGEPLARARLVLSCSGHATEQLSAADGRFTFPESAEAGCTLSVTLVGYRPLRLDPIPGSELVTMERPTTESR